MSKLSMLLGKPKKVNIGGLELEIKPLTVADLELFGMDQNAPADKQMATVKKLIHRVLKDSVPDATNEEIDQMSVEHLDELMKAITDVNKMSQSGTSKIKDAIATRQAQATSRQG